MLDTWGTVYFNFGPTTGFNTCITVYYGHLLQTERLFTKQRQYFYLQNMLNAKRNLIKCGIDNYLIKENNLQN